MKCATCGNEVTYSGVFCEHCGAWVGRPPKATKPMGQDESDHTIASFVRPADNPVNLPDNQPVNPSISQPEPEPPRHWFVVLWLLLMSAAYPVTSIMNFATGHELLGSLGLVMMVGSVALLMWQKWGFWLFAAGAAAYSIVALVNGTYLHAAGFALSVPVLFGILRIRKYGFSCWSLLR